MCGIANEKGEETDLTEEDIINITSATNGLKNKNGEEYQAIAYTFEDEEQPKKETFEKRYWIRLLYGYDLQDIDQFDDIETAKTQFELIKNYIIDNKRNKTPYLLILVDSKTDTIIEQFEEIPTEDIKN